MGGEIFNHFFILFSQVQKFRSWGLPPLLFLSCYKFFYLISQILYFNNQLNNFFNIIISISPPNLPSIPTSTFPSHTFPPSIPAYPSSICHHPSSICPPSIIHLLSICPSIFHC